jgi:hypothetical protein
MADCDFEMPCHCPRPTNRLADRIGVISATVIRAVS